MEEKNQTAVTEFLFLGLTDHFLQKIVFFIMFLFVYLATLGGNLGMITLIWVDPRLHTPMYFFLSHLSFVDVCSSSSKMLHDIFAEKKSISFVGCAAQMWFLGIFMTAECFLLASMAYDRYTAICNPLLYTLIMSQRVYVQLVIGPYVLADINITTHTTLTFCLPFCGSNIINHFFCDIFPLFSLACAESWINKIVLFVFSGAIGVSSGLIIIISYVCIFMAILKIQTTDGRRKAFSTCSSNLVAVSILYGTLFFTYVRPSASFSLNLLIYSLRNKEVKGAFRRKMQMKYFRIGG
ncbi:olfactory receptor 998-like [Nannospalax galili]|uniref:olfactory receptor 998-like n=1 Tax=Nannospalax galili TaxID=1026970 RepID=UPI0004ED1FC9|nr:olfactory receptor 998-like [Nannospalax galili]